MEFKITQTPFKTYDGTVQQGCVEVSELRMATLLGSCVCIGFYHAGRKLAGFSHVTGFSDEGGHSAEGAYNALELAFRKQGINLKHCECFVVGGSDRGKHVYDSVIELLDSKGFPYEILDALGNFHRKLMIDPQTGQLTLFKKISASREPVGDVYRPSGNQERFSNSRMRIATGASVWFRNSELLSLLPLILDDPALKAGKRIHIWCAGCSVGLEVYSLAIAALGHLDKSGRGSLLKVLGTDISEDAVEQARKGEYLVDQKRLEGFAPLFERHVDRLDSNRISVGDRLRQTCVFAQRDIEHGSRQHKFELIICDHVLQYYPDEDQMRYAEKLAAAVVSSGFIYISTPSLRVREMLTTRLQFKQIRGQLYRVPAG